jgi:integrase
MATVFKPKYIENIPRDAEIIEKNARKYAQYIDKRGKRVCLPILAGGKIRRETSHWYIQYIDENGKQRKVRGFLDKKATEQKCAEMERNIEYIKSGLRPREYEHLQRPLKEHLLDYQADMRARGITERQAVEVHKRVTCILDACGFKVWADIDQLRTERYLAERRKDTETKRGNAPQTTNLYLEALKAFCNWLVRNGRAPSNPVAFLRKQNVRVDIRHKRRALSNDESKSLINFTMNDASRMGMPGPERALLYQTALQTGFRASELRTLTVGACLLNETVPVLVIKAAYSKHREEDRQPIPSELVEALRAHIAWHQKDELVFAHMPAIRNLSQMLRGDLKRVGIAHKDESGRYVDFHALRHTFITNLTLQNIPPKIAMDLARHKSINLTMEYYSHTMVKDKADALDVLPKLRGDPKKMGTDNS